MRVGVTPVGIEKHYRVAELVTLWGYSRSIIVQAFSAEPDVMRWCSAGAKRKYETISIPESVVLRVHDRICQQSLQASLAARNPPRIILLRDRNRAVAKKPAHISDLKSRQELADRKRVA